MESYKVIRDIAELNKFIAWLPELEEQETFYLSLLARNKYCKDIVHIKSDRQQLKRVTTTKERMVDKIMQMECPLDCYKQRETPIPQEALALYIHPNPRNLKKACIASARKLVELVTSEPFNNCNPHQEVMSAIQNSRSRKVFVDFDYDHLDYDEFLSIVVDRFINLGALSTIKTHGGFHALVRPDRVSPAFNKVWYMGLNNLIADKDKAVGDMLLPVPGSSQGNFTPHFMLLDGVKQ